MTDSRDDPPYLRRVGLTILAALLVVASCQVEQPPSTVETAQVTVGVPPEVIDSTERIVVTVTVTCELRCAPRLPTRILQQSTIGQSGLHSHDRPARNDEQGRCPGCLDQ
jgi:hypothetical protein